MCRNTFKEVMINKLQGIIMEMLFRKSIYSFRSLLLSNQRLKIPQKTLYVLPEIKDKMMLK